MATARIHANRLPIQCPVCLETYTRPRTLPCLHSFCTSCLHAHIVSREGAFSSFPCPVCRATTRPPRPFAPKDTWAETFPLNHLIVSIIEEASSVFDESIYCDTHTDTKINLFCIDHEVVCCAVCVAVDHRRCQQVEEIAKLVDKTKPDLEKLNIEVLEKLKQSEHVLTDLDAKCALAESNLQIDKDKMSSEIETEFVKAMEHLEHLKDVALGNIETKVEEIKTEINTRKVICNKGNQLCKDVKEFLNQVCSSRSPYTSFIKIHKASALVRRFNLETANNWAFNEANSLKFETNFKLAGISNIDTFGEVIDTRKARFGMTFGSSVCNAVNGRAVASVGYNHDHAHTNTRQKDRVTLQLQNRETSINDGRDHGSQESTPAIISLDSCPGLRREFPCTGDLLKGHWISGMTLLSHGLLLACDQTDKILCLVKNSGMLFVDRRGTPPWGVAKLSDSQVVVTYPQENVVRIFEIKYSGLLQKFFRKPSLTGRPISFLKRFGTSEACFGVDAIGDRIVVACEDCIKVFTPNGRCTSLLKHSEPTERRLERRFGRIVDVAYDAINSVLYAVDEDTNSLLAFRVTDKQPSQEPLFVFKDMVLKRPQSVTVDANGNKLVTGFVSRTIHILNKDNVCTTILATEDRPFSISTDSGLLAVGFYQEPKEEHGIATGDVRYFRSFI